MVKGRVWLLSLVVFSACTCGVRSECNAGRVQVGLLTSIHDDPACRELSPKGVLMFEAANHIADAHNLKTSGFKIEVIVQDTCGTLTGSLRAAMKTMVMADVNCLQPPNLLGLIGPDSLTNAEAVNKVTSVLKVPLVVKKTNNAPFMHYLAKESDTYLVKGAIKLLQFLKWKSFTLATSSDDNNDDDVQNIAKKLTTEAIANNMCVMIYDEDTGYSSRILHIGNPKKSDFFSDVSNATVVILSEGSLGQHISATDSTNNILLLEDSRNDFAGLEARVEKSNLWSGSNQGSKFDAESLRDVRWLKDAVYSYSQALEAVCKKKKCKNQLNPADWNIALSTALDATNMNVRTGLRALKLMLKMKGNSLQELGNVLVMKNMAKMFWKGQALVDDEDEFIGHREGPDDIPVKFKPLISKEKSVGSGCATSAADIKFDDDEDHRSPVFVSPDMDDDDWWTMVITVSGVGIAMFVVGIFAVYVLISNIRGPKQKNKSRFNRSGSFRRNSETNIPATVRTPPRPPPRAPQRNDSIQSAYSENGV